jgi:hypothetical protein
LYLRFNHLAAKSPRAILYVTHRNGQLRRGNRTHMLLLSDQVAIDEEADYLTVIRPGQVVEPR